MTSVSTVGYLVDTNILIYTYDSIDLTKRRRATEVLQRLEFAHSGAFSTQILGEFFAASTKKLRPPLTAAQAHRSVLNWAHSWPVFDITLGTVLEALRGTQRYQMQYWDALIWATARQNGIPTVLTEDYSDGAIIEGVRYRNPFTPSFDPVTL